MIEAIATSDWHFMSLNKHFRNAVDRQLYEIDKIYKYALDNGIQHVIVAGDISNTPHLDVDTYIKLVLFLKKYDGIINTYYIAGNHDFSDIKKTSLDFLQVLTESGFYTSFHLYLKPSLEVIDDCPIFFAPYPCLQSEEYESPKLNIAHVTYTGALGDNGRALRAKHEFQQSEGDFTISGHIHAHQALPNKRAVYCGNPYQVNFGEALPKGFIHFKAKLEDEELKFGFKFVSLKPDFQLINLHINSPGDFASLSTSDALRYKLWLGEGVSLPKDLRMKYPNITGGVFDKKSKLLMEAEASDSVTIDTSAASVIDVNAGLASFFKTNGFTKMQYKEAKAMVETARNELGL